VNNLTATRLRTIAITRDAEIPDAFAGATIAAAANGKGSRNDRRRYANRSRIVASYLDAAEQLGGNQTIAGQEHMIRAIKEADACSFCRHGVPSNAYCRWCTEGVEPEQAVMLTEEEREAKRAAIRADWSAGKHIVRIGGGSK
jgi:hypothetical protein